MNDQYDINASDPAPDTFTVPDLNVQRDIRANRRALANKLISKGLDTMGEMRGRVYVPKNPWVNFAEGAVGGVLNQGIDQEAQDEALQLQNIRAELLRRMPSATVKGATTPAGNNPDEEGSYTAPDAPKDPRQYSDEVGRWGIKALQVPGLETLGKEAAQEVFQGPRRQAEQQAAAEAKKETLRQTLEARAAEAEANRNWREAEANRSRDDREAARQLNAEDRAAAAREARADRAANAAAIRAEKAAQGKPLPAHAQKTQQAIMNLDSGLAAYNDILEGYNPQSTDAANMTKRAQLGTAFTDMQMRLKEAYELGAITGPDMHILESALSNPTSLTGTLKGAAFGRDTFKAQSGEVGNVLNRLRGNFESQYGVTIPPSARTAPPQQSASGKIGAPSPSPAAKRYRLKPGANPDLKSSYEEY